MSVFRALRHRDFALFFSGQLVSMVGTWMQNVALGWWVFRLTGRESMLGLVLFASTAPAVLLSPLGGLAADRMKARHLLMLTQAGLLLQAVAMSWLAFRGTTHLWPIMTLAVAMGIVSAFDLPGRQVLVAQVVDRDDLPNAIALSSALFHGSRIVGPALAGLLLAVSHEGWCFLVNAVSYLAALGVLVLMRTRPTGAARPGGSALDHLREGFRFAWNHRSIRHLVGLTALVVGLGMPFTAMLPPVVKEILHAGPRQLGWLMGCSGVGATLGALALASRKDPRGLDRAMILAGLAFAIFLGLFSHSRVLGLSCGLLAFTSFSLVSMNTACNTLLQVQAPDAFRGRVMALYGMAFMAAMPVGTLCTGLLAEVIGVPWALTWGAAGCLVGITVFAGLYSPPEELPPVAGKAV